MDAETLLRDARRPLVLGIGGGGDVVGALATAEHLRRYTGAEPVLGGLTWERRPIDPLPGPRTGAEISGASEIAPGVMLAGPSTQVGASGVRFAESRMAEVLGRPTVLIDINPGPVSVAEGLRAAVAELGCDLVVFLDVGGDVLAAGHEPGLRSPLCDAVMLAAAERMRVAGIPGLLAVFGAGCDSELTGDEVLARIAAVAGEGGLLAARGMTPEVGAVVEEAVAAVPTEASAMALRAFRGGVGTVAIRGGERRFELSLIAAVTFFLDVGISFRVAGPLAQAVAGALSLEAANDALHELGVRTELDLERAAGA